MIEIWQPRYKDQVCLIAGYKVKAGKNRIKFTKARHLEGMLFEIEGELIKKCPVDSNGKIGCFAVPMDLLERVE